jgi:hypothetical protein
MGVVKVTGTIRQHFRMTRPFTFMAGKIPFKTTLMAPCGMDCAVCSAFLRKKNRCPGCYAPDRRCNKNCTISSCEHIRGRYRHECGEFPCKQLRQMDTRYRAKYGMSMIANLAAIQEHGVREFVKTERERWTCKACGGTIDIHHGMCSACGKGRE